MTTIQKSQAFSFKNQAVNYSKFRPKYPDLLYVNQVNCLPSHKKYLDAAMGTGQLLFPIASHFEQCRGIDISQKMLQSAKNNLQAYLKDHQNVNIKIQKQSLLDLATQTQKYDLITIGQALHWLPIEQAIKKMKNMLTDDGKLLIMGYGLKFIQNYVNPQKKEDNILYEKFYNKINSLGVEVFGFNRDQVKEHYSNQQRYPFAKHFDHVKRNQAQVRVRMNREQFQCYLRTFAEYNLYLQKFQDDPLVEVMDKISNQIECVFTFFVIVCQK